MTRSVWLPLAACGGFWWSLASAVDAAEHPAPLPVANAEASTPEQMKPYSELIEHADVKIEMVPIPGGSFRMGSPSSEDGRRPDEGPQHDVRIEPFWMAKFETTWEAYEVWMDDLDIYRRQALGFGETPRDKLAVVYQISQPTEPYTDMSFGMGKGKRPAICMTQHAARTFCKWLSAKTGRYYRLPTEAEWEYACRAGTNTAYYFGDDPAKLSEHAWFKENSQGKYQRVGQKKPNPWGLYDMHGNVAEWVLDQYVPDFYAQPAAAQLEPLAIPKTLYPRVVRGGGWSHLPPELRSAARMASNESWKEQDPQDPQSIWYHTDARFVGFRIIRPLKVPSDDELNAKWDNSLPVQKDVEE